MELIKLVLSLEIAYIDRYIYTKFTNLCRIQSIYELQTQ